MCGVFVCTPIDPCTSSCAAAAAVFSHPFLFFSRSLQRDHHRTLSARHRSPPRYPPLMTAPFTPLGKSVISPPDGLVSPLISSSVLSWRGCAVPFLMLSHRLPFALVAAPQSGTSFAHQFVMLKHF